MQPPTSKDIPKHESGKANLKYTKNVAKSKALNSTDGNTSLRRHIHWSCEPGIYMKDTRQAEAKIAKLTIY